MKESKIKGIDEYFKLIKYLKTDGFYHKRLQGCLYISWLISGLLEAIFDMKVAEEEQASYFYSQEGCQVVAMIVFAYLSLTFGRQLVNRILVSGMMVGVTILLVAVRCCANLTGELIGISLISTVHYSITFNLLFLSIQYFLPTDYPKLLVTALFSFIVGKIICVCIVFYVIGQESLSFFVILPACCLMAATLPFYTQSPRFLIDTNIIKAEELIKNIVKVNGLQCTDVQELMQGQFFWNKINLKKYGLEIFYSYKSLSYQIYTSYMCFLMLGVVCRCPDFILHIENQTKANFKVEDSIEILWVSSFQIIALLPAYVSMSVLKRKQMIITSTIIVMLISFILAFLDSNQLNFDDAIVYSMALFGLNSFFCMFLFSFLLLHSFEYLPHTIRTLVVGVLFSGYKFGRLLFSLHIEFINNNSVLLELVLCSSILLGLHSILIKETLNSKIQYEILEIEENQEEEGQ